MTRFAAAAALASLPICACSYGPITDRSGAQSAVLLPDQRTVAVAYQALRYRPATGAAAFPDGGIPQYVQDSAVIATTGIAGGPPHILQRLENRGVHGSAGLSLRLPEADPDHLLVVASVQPSTAQPSTSRWWRLDWRDGRIDRYPDLKADLSSRGRTLGSPEFGDVRVIDRDGTLLIGAQAAGENELWIRKPTGQYQGLGTIKHFYGVLGDELYLWSGDEALVHNWRTGQRRIIARYDPSARQTTRLIPDDPTVRAMERAPPPRGVVTVASDRSSLIVRRPDGGQTSVRLPAAELGG